MARKDLTDDLQNYFKIVAYLCLLKYFKKEFSLSSTVSQNQTVMFQQEVLLQ